MVVKVAERIKELREMNGITQSQLAKRLDVTRSSVNAWEMGISIPSVAKLVEISGLFHVSTDYLLGLEQHKSISIDSFSPEEQKIMYNLAEYFQSVHAD